ncbi:hypothetical protein SAMD00023353_0402830 [Rosellinia necatrix]|uniref:Uncharacterized protein n=1 Tax=Rosellinia necatrix TaxID=77044 RepID=A0A1S7UJR0_ROSNE|nr:hypothetical protein SAMD00023353_0402830 [Rosellinia necatrix]
MAPGTHEDSYLACRYVICLLPLYSWCQRSGIIMVVCRAASRDVLHKRARRSSRDQLATGSNQRLGPIESPLRRPTSVPCHEVDERTVSGKPRMRLSALRMPWGDPSSRFNSSECGGLLRKLSNHGPLWSPRSFNVPGHRLARSIRGMEDPVLATGSYDYCRGQLRLKSGFKPSGNSPQYSMSHRLCWGLGNRLVQNRNHSVM